MKNFYTKTILSIVALLAFSTIGFAQTTAFNYQGSLNSGGTPASGNHDFEFALFDAASGGAQLGSMLTQNSVAVTNGIFAVSLDFGSQFPGANRFLEIRVRQAGGGAFTQLTPRQPVTSAPYAVKSLSADTATNAANASNAANAVNATNAVNFSGGLSGDVSGTQSSTAVTRLQGRDVSSTAPLGGQVLKFNSATGQWVPDTDIVGTGGGGGTITGVTPGTGLSGGGASGNVTLNIANGGVGTAQLADGGVTDAKINSVSGGKVTGTVANATNAVNATNAANATNAINAANASNATNAVNATNATNAATAVNFSGALGGDVTGNQTATTVARLRDVSLPAPVVADNGRVLKYKNNGVDPITLEWATDNTSAGGGGVTSVTASGPLASNGGATPNISLTGVVPAANGGTGLNAAGANGNFLRSNGTNWTSSVIQASDLSSLGGSFIQNTTTTQAGANFSIGGNGIVGGTLGLGTTPIAGVRLDINGGTRITGGGSGGVTNFGAPNGESGMSISSINRADVRFDGTTLKLFAGTGVSPPGFGIAVNTSGGATITGTNGDGAVLTARRSGGDSFVAIDATAVSQNSVLAYRKNNFNRWLMFANGAAETGGNEGSDFQIDAYNNAGGIANYFFIKRATGNVGIGAPDPSAYGHGGTNKLVEIRNPAGAVDSQAHAILSTGSTSTGSIGTITWAVPNTAGGEKRAALVASSIEGSAAGSVTSNLSFWTNNNGTLGEKMKITPEGNITQPIAANGLVKAMIVVPGFGGEPSYCYNGITNSSTGTCGFNATRPFATIGIVRIDFGFPVANRFVTVTAQYASAFGSGNNNVGVNYRFFNATSIEFFSFITGSPDTRNASYTIILY